GAAPIQIFDSKFFVVLSLLKLKLDCMSFVEVSKNWFVVRTLVLPPVSSNIKSGGAGMIGEDTAVPFPYRDLFIVGTLQKPCPDFGLY
ncbi:hypothetical protein, partial [Microcoleus sp. herbarium14]|uniref:hypothetical protein n=1 Tax=Microcoleus sp. herbarium14 TaxID=3055439 RepID=UPI002FD46733